MQKWNWKLHFSDFYYLPLLKSRRSYQRVAFLAPEPWLAIFLQGYFSASVYTVIRTSSWLRFMFCPATLSIQTQKHWFWHGIKTLRRAVANTGDSLIDEPVTVSPTLVTIAWVGSNTLWYQAHFWRSVEQRCRHIWLPMRHWRYWLPGIWFHKVVGVINARF